MPDQTTTAQVEDRSVDLSATMTILPSGAPVGLSASAMASHATQMAQMARARAETIASLTLEIEALETAAGIPMPTLRSLLGLPA